MNSGLLALISGETALIGVLTVSERGARPDLTDATSRATAELDEMLVPMAEAASGPPRDLDSFLASVEHRAFRLAELALGHREDALDALQEAMFKLVRYQSRSPDEWPALFWSILRRQITDRHRRNQVKRRVFAFFGRDETDRGDPLERHADPGQDPVRHHQDSAAWEALGRALQALPRRQRECFLLRELQGLSVGETALAMGCSDGSVKTHLSRAISALRVHLEDWQ
jgi:RNA polymerase sigma-70 factor (ECF subfamily)